MVSQDVLARADSEKCRIREAMTQKRVDLSSVEIGLKSLEIGETIPALKTFQEAQDVLFFKSMPEEVQTDKMMEHALSIGKRIYLPVVDNQFKTLKITCVEDMKVEYGQGMFGILEPIESCRQYVDPDKLDCVITPGLAFDLKGGRLGFGGGYFDKLFDCLSFKTVRIGIAFDFQLIQKLPLDFHDQKVHWVVTENRTVKCQ